MNEQILSFAGDNEALIFVLAVLAMICLAVILSFIYGCFAKAIRALQIVVRGWPPRHCDADGDAVEVDVDSEVTGFTPECDSPIATDGEHTWEEWEVALDGTTQSRKCSNCGWVERQAVPKSTGS